MSEFEYEGWNVIGSAQGQTKAFSVTSTAANVDLSADGNLGVAFKAGRMLRLRADGCDVYYFFGADNAQTIDDTKTGATNPEQQCDVIPNGQYVDVRPPIGALSGNLKGKWTFLYYKSATGASGKLRVTISSESREQAMA